MALRRRAAVRVNKNAQERLARWQPTSARNERHAVREVLSSNDSESSCDRWSQLSADFGESDPPLARKRSASSIARLKSWEQTMKRSHRNGGVGATSGSVGHCQWLPRATVEEFMWAGDPDTSLSIRKEMPHDSHQGGDRRVEIDIANLLRAIVCRTEEEHGA